MKQYAEKLRKRLIISSIIFVGTIFFILTLLILYVHEANCNKIIIDFKRLTKRSFNHVMKTDVLKYEYISKRIANDKYVKKSLIEKNRKKLYEHLKPEWKMLCAENSYLKIMLFVLPDNKAFLRMHKPNVYNDDLTYARPMIRAINKNHKILFGYETGKYSTVYRIVTPIFENKKYIGALDLGINPIFIIDKIKNITGYQGFLFIKKSSLQLFNRNADIEIGDFILQRNPNNNINNIAEFFKENAKKELLKEGRVFFYKGKRYLTHVLDIKDYAGSIDAKLLFLQDVTNIYYSRLYFMYSLIGVAFLGLFIIIIFINNQTKALEKELIRINEKHLQNIEKEKKELKNFKNIFDLFMNHSPLLISIKDESLRYVYTNKAFTEWTNKKDLIGKDIFEVASNKETARKINELDKEALKKGVIESIETIKNSKGEDRILRIHKLGINFKNKKYLGGIVADITENYLAHQKIIEGERILRKAQEIAKMGYFIYKVNSKELLLSDELLKAFGFDKTKFNNTRAEFLAFVHEEDRIKINTAFLKTLQEGVENKVEYRLIRPKDNALRYFEARYEAVYDENGNIKEVMGIAQDITEKIELQKEIEEKSKLMLAQSRHATMGEMISMIAHQWRQPLSVIAMGANNIIVDIELGEFSENDIKRAAEEIIQQTQYLSKTIEDFRDFFKPSKNKDTIIVNDIIEDAIRFIDKSLQHNMISLNKNYDSESEIITYSRQLLQVLITILQNSKEALVEKVAKNRKIDIFSYENADNVYIKICDNAGGIDSSISDKVFEPYFSTKEEKTGTGLGLYMAKIIVEKHIKGRIWFENTQKGVCFIVEIPKRKC